MKTLKGLNHNTIAARFIINLMWQRKIGTGTELWGGGGRKRYFEKYTGLQFAHLRAKLL